MKPVYGAPRTVYGNAFHKVFCVRATAGTDWKDLYVTDYGSRVGVLVEGPRGVLLTRQYRYIIDALSWEIPGGKVDDRETAEEAAVRECLEETGIRCRTLRPLIAFQPGLDTLRNPTQVFHSTDFEIVCDGPQQPGEVVETAWIPLAECLAMVSEGKIIDSLSLLALLARSRHRQLP